MIMKAVFWLGGYSGFNANISITFQAVKNLYAHSTYLCFGPFCKCFGDF